MRRVLTLLLFCLIIMGCRRRPLEDALYLTAKIPVSIDWSVAGLDPDNDPAQNIYSASVWLFPKPGSEYRGVPLEFRLSDPRGGEIEVPIGVYAVLIFNNTVADFSGNVSFRGMESYETFEYYTLPDARTGYAGISSEPLILEPDMLAAWNLDEFEVTADMVTFTRNGSSPKSRSAKILPLVSTLTRVQPERLTYTVVSQIHVRGLKNAAAAQGALIGLGRSLLLASHKITAPPGGLCLRVRQPDLLPRFDDRRHHRSGIQHIRAPSGSLGNLHPPAPVYPFGAIRGQHDFSDPARTAVCVRCDGPGERLPAIARHPAGHRLPR